MPAKGSNSFASSVRVKSRRAGQYTGQRNHDMRTGALPGYVDRDRIDDNAVLVEPMTAKELRAINEARRNRRVPPPVRAMKSDSAVAFVGVLTLGAEAQRLFDRLFRKNQNKAFQDVAERVAKALNTTVAGLVVHYDESAPHAHFTLPAYDLDGVPLTKTIKRRTLSMLQDVVAQGFAEHCPGIVRGNSVADRVAGGEKYADTINKSVRTLHRELPADIERKRQKADREVERASMAVESARVASDAERVARERVDEMRARVAKLEEKATLTDKEAKRLETYRKRLADRIRDEEAILARVLDDAEQERARLEQEKADAERDAQALRDEVKRVRAQAEQDAKAVIAKAEQERVNAERDAQAVRVEVQALKAETVAILEQAKERLTVLKQAINALRFFAKKFKLVGPDARQVAFAVAKAQQIADEDDATPSPLCSLRR